jgi:hypothetical protein
MLLLLAMFILKAYEYITHEYQGNGDSWNIGSVPE